VNSPRSRCDVDVSAPVRDKYIAARTAAVWYERGVDRALADRTRESVASTGPWLAVAVGGAIGAGLRWAAGAAWAHDRGGWPWATLIVNLVGCVAIGVAARRLHVGTVAWAFVVTGVLGGFTTFSSFAVEVDQLIDAGRAGVALGYVMITMIGGYAATWIAYRDRPPS